MQGMILPGDGDGEHPLPWPGMPFRGWTVGRPRESAGERCDSWVRTGCDPFGFRLRHFFQSKRPTSWAYSSGHLQQGRGSYVQKPGRTGVSIGSAFAVHPGAYAPMLIVGGRAKTHRASVLLVR